MYKEIHEIYSPVQKAVIQMPVVALAVDALQQRPQHPGAAGAGGLRQLLSRA